MYTFVWVCTRKDKCLETHLSGGRGAFDRGRVAIPAISGLRFKGPCVLVVSGHVTNPGGNNEPDLWLGHVRVLGELFPGCSLPLSGKSQVHTLRVERRLLAWAGPGGVMVAPPAVVFNPCRVKPCMVGSVEPRPSGGWGLSSQYHVGRIFKSEVIQEHWYASVFRPWLAGDASMTLVR